jgi:hypothetical protein
MCGTSVWAIATIGVAGLSGARRLLELIRQHEQFALPLDVPCPAGHES